MAAPMYFTTVTIISSILLKILSTISTLDTKKHRENIKRKVITKPEFILIMFLNGIISVSAVQPIYLSIPSAYMLRR